MSVVIGDQTERKRRVKFSLWNLLAFTTILAVWIASLLAFQKYRELSRQKKALLALSSRLEVLDSQELKSVHYPRVADDWYTWEVHVPKKASHELRLGVGSVSEAGMPEAFERIPLSSGQHRVTLQAADSADELYAFRAFLDGELVAEREMGRQWMPHGWQQASGMSVPSGANGRMLELLQLDAKIYTPGLELGRGVYFNGQSDNWVTDPGYRLWVDEADQTYPATSPFIGFESDPSYRGVGLRDGLRYRTQRGQQFDWKIRRPASRTNDPVLTVIPEFFAGDQSELSSQSANFSGWRVRNEASGIRALQWKREPKKTAHSLFLHAEVDRVDAIKPVVELRFDANRPDAVGLRLPDTPANETLTKWRLRLVGGAKHLWRRIEFGDQTFHARNDSFGEESNETRQSHVIELGAGKDESSHLSWQTDVAGPLQLLQRGKMNAQAYRSMDLFQGLPVAFEAELPKASQSDVSVITITKIASAPGTPIPGGPAIDEIKIDLDAATHDWTWLTVKPRQ